MAIYIKGVNNIEVEQTIAVTKLIDGTFLYTEVSDKGRMTIYTKDVYIIPEPHGRLIDAGQLCKGLNERWKTANKEAEEVIADVLADVVVPIMVSTPTVIEGSE